MKTKPRSVLQIKATVAESFGVTVRQIDGESRKAPIVRARKVAMLLVRQLRGLSHPEIARQFNRRSHGASLGHIRSILDESVRNPELAQKIAGLFAQLNRNTQVQRRPAIPDSTTL